MPQCSFWHRYFSLGPCRKIPIGYIAPEELNSQPRGLTA